MFLAVTQANVFVYKKHNIVHLTRQAVLLHFQHSLLTNELCSSNETQTENSNSNWAPRYARHSGFINSFDVYNPFADEEKDEFLVRWVKKIDGEEIGMGVNHFLEDDFTKTDRYKAEIMEDPNGKKVDFKISISGWFPFSFDWQVRTAIWKKILFVCSSC